MVRESAGSGGPRESAGSTALRCQHLYCYYPGATSEISVLNIKRRKTSEVRWYRPRSPRVTFRKTGYIAMIRILVKTHEKITGKKC